MRLTDQEWNERYSSRLARQRAYNARPEVKAWQATPEFKSKRQAKRTTTEARARRQAVERGNRYGYLQRNMRRRLHHALKGRAKSGSAIRDLGCTIEEFKSYIETKFQLGMDWSNWGVHTWHLDHIRPLASFDLTSREQFLQAFHYTNYQPLWSSENIRKGAKRP